MQDLRSNIKMYYTPILQWVPHTLEQQKIWSYNIVSRSLTCYYSLNWYFLSSKHRIRSFFLEVHQFYLSCSKTYKKSPFSEETFNEDIIVILGGQSKMLVILLL